MIVNIKNKDTIVIGDFKLKCCVGKNGIHQNKIEGDKKTPKGIFKLGELYWRPDRVEKPITKLKCIKIRKNMGWCNDSNSGYYNKRIKLPKKIGHEKLFRNDHKYDYFILLKYNYLKVKKNKGSAIFIHLTKNYKPTDGCVAMLKKDFLIFIKLINKNCSLNLN